jgi:hypothetical protein
MGDFGRFSMGRSDDQHYVPKLLLRQFAVKKKNEWYIHVFDKHEGKTFFTNVRNVATERGFYELSIPGRTLQFDETLTFLEGRTATAFQVDNAISHKRLDARGKGVDWHVHCRSAHPREALS